MLLADSKGVNAASHTMKKLHLQISGMHCDGCVASTRDALGSLTGVTATDVTRVAKKYLDPNEMLMLIVSDWDEIYGGDLEGRASMNDFFDGNVTHLPTRDPLTLEPVR